VRSRVANVPGWAWLTALVLASWAVRFLFARHMIGPWIMIDEIVYSELAKSFAATGHFAVREAPTSGYGIVYPILISPAYRLFSSIPTVYTGIKVINSLLMSLTAVPAYLLARRVVSVRGALAVALLTVAVPSTFYAGTIMTENAFYPIFVTLALALVVALDRPGLLTVLLFLGALLVAFATRVQAVAVLPAALTAPLIAAAFVRRPREVLEQRVLYLLVAGLAIVAVGIELVRGRSINSLLGAYSVTTNSSYGVHTVARWFLWHMSELELYVGFVPVLAVVLLCVRGSSLSRPERMIVATTVSLVLWLGLEVAAFASQPSVVRIEERNLFYVAPLLFVCLVLWIERGLPRPQPALWLAVAGVILLAGALPYARFVDTSAVSDTFDVGMLWSIAVWIHEPLTTLRWIVAGAAAVFVTIAAFVPRRFGLALVVLPLALFVLAVQPVDSKMQRASIGAVFQGITRPDRDWITAIVGSNDPTRVSVVWTGLTDRLTVNENEFFNRDVGAIYTTTGPVPGGLAQTPIQLDRTTGLYLAGTKRVHVDDVLTDTSLSVNGRRIGGDPKKGLVLLHVGGPLRATDATSGIDPDSWAGSTASYRAFDCRGGSLAVELGSDPELYKTAQRVEAYNGRVLVATASVPPTQTVTMRVPLTVGPHDSCTVSFHVPRTRVPARVEPGNTDTRRLGVRFVGFTVS
jgi:hypothetical protein